MKYLFLFASLALSSNAISLRQMPDEVTEALADMKAGAEDDVSLDDFSRKDIKDAILL